LVQLEEFQFDELINLRGVLLGHESDHDGSDLRDHESDHDLIRDHDESGLIDHNEYGLGDHDESGPHDLNVVCVDC